MEKLSKETILKILQDNKKNIKEFGVKKLVLFGSFARDEQKKTSDIDFLVEFNENRGLFRDFFGLKHYLENLFSKNIDLVEYKYIRNELKNFILGDKLYEAKV